MNKSAVKHLLMIVVDDLRPELNCFGRQKLLTPNIDRLAARSVLYERAYCQFPQCMPSRVSFMSGIRPQEFCNWSNQVCRHGEPTLPLHLKASGMKTVSVGKVYHEPLDDAFAWDELYMDSFMSGPKGGMEHSFHDYQLPENQDRTKVKFKLDYSQWCSAGEMLPPLSECAEAPDDGYVDAQVAKRAMDCIEAHRGDPRGLFLAVGFYRPHLPWVAPKKYWDLYDRDEVDLADNPFFPKDGVGKSDLCDLMHYGDEEVQRLFSDVGRYDDDDFPVLSEAKQRECIHAYWACVSFLDAQVGRLLDVLDAAGMADETAVILCGDNGWHLGEHKLWSKVTNFEESTRVPLLLSVPGRTLETQHTGLVELLDIYPTCCDLLGLELPEHLDGDVLPFDAETPGKPCAYSISWNGKTVLDDRYRLTYYPFEDQNIISGRGQYELFDHECDPAENVNVANDPAYSEVMQRLLEKLQAQASGC
ncbi:sulfatase [Coraliomargarita parva]|uniref:sulfatase n=1 Tax=Coraliomargarita parva TaxID=3014050 RepID=UPI0022B2F609|nr:sulfatase [Coraliomargarita parva]